MPRYGWEYGRGYEMDAGGDRGYGPDRSEFQRSRYDYGWKGFGGGAANPYDAELQAGGYGYEPWGAGQGGYEPPQGGDPYRSWRAAGDRYGGFSGSGYRTFQQGYGDDYGAAGYGSPRGRGGYGGGYGGYEGGYERGYPGGHGYGRQSAGEWRGSMRSRASELMTENPEVVTPDATLNEVALKMKDLDVGIIPVVDSLENRRLRGVITDRDIAVRAVAEGRDGKAKVSDCMTAHVETVNKNDSVDRVLELMEREQVRRVPVTDRDGRIVGIIAQADLAVEYGEGRPHAERQVQHAIERISEPARPQRHGGAMAAATGRDRNAQAKGEPPQDER
jgi:CBS domain-containing protein